MKTIGNDYRFYVGWGVVVFGYFLLTNYLIDLSSRFPDLINYWQLFVDTRDYGMFAGSTFQNTFSLLVSEPVWRALVALGVVSFDEPRSFTTFVSMISVSITSRFVLQRNRDVFLLFLFFNPLFLDFFIGQLRNSLALAFFLVWLELNRKPWAFTLLLLSVLIHTSIILLVLVFFSVRFMSRIRTESQKVFWVFSAVCIGAGIAFLMSYGQQFLLEILGDRRVGVVYGSSSLVYSFFWLILAVFLLLLPRYQGLPLTERLNLFAAGVVFITGFFTSVLGGYSSRFFAMALSFGLVALRNIGRADRMVIYGILLIYQLVQLRYWLL